MTIAIEPLPAEAAPVASGRGRVRQLWAHPSGLVGLVVVIILALVAIAAALGLTPHPPLEQNAARRFDAPSIDHWLGTDQFGRDIASRVMEGVLASLRVALVAVAISALIGSAAGIAAGYFGGWTDRIIGLLTGMLFAFPAILLALAVLTALGRGWFNTVIAIAIVYTPIFVRVARGPVLSVRELDFVKAGRVLGFGPSRLLLRHVLPNVTAPIIVQIALALSWAILTESSLSFLGLGTQPPDPSLGLMVSEARTLVTRGWWLMAAPASAIVLAVIGLNLLGDGLRDAFDPTRRGALTMDLAHLLTEQHRPELADLDLRATADLVRLMAEDHALAIEAIVATQDRIAAAIDAIVDRLQRGGRLIYVGAGTAGRMGVLDAAECLPTFNTDRVVGVLAGGSAALLKSSEAVEDDEAAGAEDMTSLDPSELDAVVGVTASGRTPYTIGAVRYARSRGAVTIGIASNPDAVLSGHVHHPIELVVGPEVIAGSTRLKAGTAQKIALNMISTISMVRLGKTFGNLMVDVRATNHKLRARAKRIVVQATGATPATAEQAIDTAQGDVKVAIVMLLADIDADAARARLVEHQGMVRAALEES